MAEDNSKFVAKFRSMLAKRDASAGSAFNGPSAFNPRSRAGKVSGIGPKRRIPSAFTLARKKATPKSKTKSKSGE